HAPGHREAQGRDASGWRDQGVGVLGGPLDHLVDGLVSAVERLEPRAAVAVVGGAVHELALRALRDREDGGAVRRLHDLIALAARRGDRLVEDAVQVLVALAARLHGNRGRRPAGGGGGVRARGAGPATRPRPAPAGGGCNPPPPDKRGGPPGTNPGVVFWAPAPPAPPITPPPPPPRAAARGALPLPPP